MEKYFSYLIITTIAWFMFLLSCKKEKSCEGCINGHKPPIAVAGPDQVITLPTDSISLDGSSSSDPDGTISDWLWTKISGPVSFTANSICDFSKQHNLYSGRLCKWVQRSLEAGVLKALNQFS